jgi:hypothetical protein
MDFMDVALGNSDDNSKYDDLVLSTHQIPFDLCWVIKLAKVCSNFIDLFIPQSSNYEFAL